MEGRPLFNHSQTRWSTRLLSGAIFALLGWSSWARGGTPTGLQGPLPWLALAILIFLALDRWTVASSPLSTSNHQPSTILIFWAGLAFLTLLTIQWWNAGRYPFFHPFDKQWVFTPPPHPGWPWAVNRDDAAEMLRWFFPAWALMLALKMAPRPDWLAKRVAWFIMINAGLLAAFGLVQALSGTHKIFWITPLPVHFFASFGYENHAASYFALLFPFSAGIVLQSLTIKGDRVRNLRGKATRLPTTIASACMWLCLAGMALSLSRTGLALTIGLTGVALMVAARLFWPRVSIAQRVTITVVLTMGLAIFFFVVASMGGKPLAKEARHLYRAHLTHEVSVRVFMAQSAAKIWASEPWFGVGGWGYRHFMPIHALEGTGTKLCPGYANTHNDALQFLCEFGIVGLGLMLTATMAFAWPLITNLRRHLTPGLALAGAGLLAVLGHSLIDLPFRCPGILYAWLAVLGISQYALGNDHAEPPSR